MQIKADLKQSDGSITHVEYIDADSFDSLEYEKVHQAYGVCFVGKKLVIVFNGKSKKWSLVGGSMEVGETYEECLRREIMEESNMHVLSFQPIGYQTIYMGQEEPFHQLRYICSVEPIAPFISDPAGKIVEVKLIEPKIYRKYFDWGEIGERLIQRGLELLKK